MGAVEVVLNQPFGEFFVEYGRIRESLPPTNELFLEGAVEPLAHGVVLGGLGAAPPMLKLEVPDGRLKVLVELAAVVRLDVHELPSQDVVELSQEVGGGERAVGPVHPREREPRVPVHGREDKPPLAVEVPRDGVEAEQEARARLCHEARDPLLVLGAQPFGGRPRVLFGVGIEAVLLDDPLDLPRGQRVPVTVAVQDRELHLGIVGIELAQTNRSAFFLRRDRGRPDPVRAVTMVFERPQVHVREPFLPDVEGLGRDPEAAARRPRVPAVAFVPQHPLQPPPRFPRETLLFGDGAESFRAGLHGLGPLPVGEDIGVLCAEDRDRAAGILTKRGKGSHTRLMGMIRNR